MSHKHIPLPPLSRVEELLELKGGNLHWRVSKGTARAGELAGFRMKGAKTIWVCIDGCRYQGKRIAYLLGYGVDPIGFEVKQTHFNPFQFGPELLELVP